MSGKKNSQPFFVPEDLDFDQLPEGFKEVVMKLVHEDYPELVEGADDALKRAAGRTLLAFSFLELVELFRVNSLIAARQAKEGESPRVPTMFFEPETLYKIVDRKLKSAKLLLQLRTFSARQRHEFKRPEKNDA